MADWLALTPERPAQVNSPLFRQVPFAKLITMKVEDVIVSTTPQVAGWRIVSHLDIVTAHVAKHSKDHERKFKKMDKEVINTLRERVANKDGPAGPRGTIGIRIDYSFPPVSVGDMDVDVLATATGTAVRLRSTK